MEAFAFARQQVASPRRPNPHEAAQRLYNDDPRLTLRQRVLLGILADLSQEGRAWAGKRYLAQYLGVSTRQVQRLLGQVHKLGYLAITPRRGRTSLYQVLQPAREQNGAARDTLLRCGKRARPRTSMSQGVETSMSPPGETRMSPNFHTGIPDIRRPAAEVSAQLGLFEPPRAFNPLRPAPRAGAYDNRSPEQRLGDAIREGRVLHVLVNGRPRTICGYSYNAGGAYFRLAIDDQPGETELWTCPLLRLGGLKLWR